MKMATERCQTIRGQAVNFLQEVSPQNGLEVDHGRRQVNCKSAERGVASDHLRMKILASQPSGKTVTLIKYFYFCRIVI
jgi:hypothetical protein